MIRVGYQDVFGTMPTMDALVRVVSEYALGEALELLAGVNHLLRGTEEPASPQTQQEALAFFFGDRAPEFWARAEARRQGKTRIAFAGELVILTLAKIVFLVCEDTPTRPRVDPGPLGAALLMTNDLVLAREDPSVPIPPDFDVLGDPSWRLRMFMTTRFHQSSHTLQEFARAAELFHKDRPHLRARAEKQYVDLPALLDRVTGLSPIPLWAVLMGLLGRFQSNRGAELRRSLDAWFAKLPSTLVPGAVARFVTPAPALGALVRAAYSLDDLKLYHVLPFAQHPLIGVQEAVVCLSSQLLTDRLGMGLYHAFFDPVLVEKATRSRCKEFIGHVFQDYVDDLFGRVFPETPLARRWCPETVLKPLSPVGRKLVDGILVYEDSVVLIEAKASVLSVATLMGDPEMFTRQLDDIVVDAAEQMEGTIASIREGCFERLGIMRTVKRCYPLVVSLDRVGMNLWLRRYINDRLAAKGLLRGTDTSVLHVMEIGELEFLEGGLDSGERLDRVLESKTGAPLLENSSFWNAWYLERPPFFTMRNRYLESVFTRRSEEVEAWLRSEGAT